MSPHEDSGKTRKKTIIFCFFCKTLVFFFLKKSRQHNLRIRIRPPCLFNRAAKSNKKLKPVSLSEKHGMSKQKFLFLQRKTKGVESLFFFFRFPPFPFHSTTKKILHVSNKEVATSLFSCLCEDVTYSLQRLPTKYD